jgi:hypothetical protein
MPEPRAVAGHGSPAPARLLAALRRADDPQTTAYAGRRALSEITSSSASSTKFIATEEPP